MKVTKIKALPDNQLDPSLMSICINLNTFPANVSAGRQYMLGGNVGKSVRTLGATPRRIITGFEKQYGDQTRNIVAPSNMIVEKVFYRKDPNGNGIDSNDWTERHIVFFNEELQMYDVLTLPRFNTQNSYVGFEYVYDQNMLNRLNEEGATFKKGEVFARSPSIGDSGEWRYGIEANVCGMTTHYTEEDGIGVVEDFLEKLTCTFEHHRDFSYNESEYVPLNLYGTIENPRAFPENGEPIRPDNIVMGFRRRDDVSALVSMTKRGLMRPNLTYDILFFAPSGSVVTDVVVTTERYKIRKHNRSAEKKVYRHAENLEKHANAMDRLANEIKEWTIRLESRFKNTDLPITNELFNFLFKQGFGEIIRDHRTGMYNEVKNTHRNKNKLDWNISITLKESVRGKKRFKLTDGSGGKGVIVYVIPNDRAPITADGRRADIVVNNTPTFRRQIFTSLIEPYINMINMEVYDRIKVEVAKPNGYQKAWASLSEFYTSVNPEFGEMASIAFPTEDEQADHVDYILKNEMISVHIKSNSEYTGLALVQRLMERYPNIKPQKVYYKNELGKTIETLEPVIISSMYYMLLNKFGTDISAQAIPKRNLFGLPAKLSNSDRYRGWHRSQPGRNVGEDESKTKLTQTGAEEVIRQLVIANSPTVSLKIPQRLIRSEDPMNVKELIRESEYSNSRSLHMTMNMLNDAGHDLREETDEDLTP